MTHVTADITEASTAYSNPRATVISMDTYPDTRTEDGYLLHTPGNTLLCLIIHNTDGTFSRITADNPVTAPYG